MIPSGYKEDVVYSPIPTNGNGDLSFTRASNGTRVNSAGLVEVVAWNLATNSENFSSWNLANVTVTTNDITAPNGTLTADKLTISNNANDVKQTISVMPNSVYTWTFYVYGGTALGQQMRFYDNTNSTNIEYYDYSSSVVLGAWVKIERTFTTPSGCYEIQAWVLAATSTIGTMWAWGCQLNIGSTAKPYFPTTDRLNVPRLTYQNGGGGCPSLLLEKQSTNLALYSEQFDNAVWNLAGTITVTANATTSPDGTQNADLFSHGSSSNYTYQNLGVLSGTITTSIFVKKGTQSDIAFGFVAGGYTGGMSVIFNFDTQTFSTPTNYSNFTSISATYQSYGNGWYRLNLTGTTATSNTYFYVVGSLLDSFSVNAYLYGAQVEASSYPTSYIPTTSASATRVADACSKTGISSLIGQTSGSVFFDFTVDSVTQPSDPVLWYMKDGGSGERYVELYSNGNLVYAEIDGGGPIAIITKSALTVGRHKCAIAYATNDFVFYVDGVQIGTDTSGTPNGFSTFGLQYYLSAYTGNQKVNQAVLFKTRLTNAELASLTTI
jgi:hypothetical protein